MQEVRYCDMIAIIRTFAILHHTDRCPGMFQKLNGGRRHSAEKLKVRVYSKLFYFFIFQI